MEGNEEMKVSNCCGAEFYEPGYPDNDICSACGEHAGAEDEEEPSMTEEWREKIKFINKDEKL